MFDKLRLTLSGLWFGVASFFSFIVAPVAFQSLTSQQLAGNLISKTLGITEIIGITAGLSLIVISLLTLSHGERKSSYVYDLVFSFFMALSMLLSKFAVSGRLRDLRNSIGDFSSLPVDNPVKIEFDQYHKYSVWLMTFNLFITFIMIVMTLIRSGNASDSQS